MRCDSQAVVSWMSDAAPLELDRLLSARDVSSRELAWERLIADHSSLLLRVARSLGGGHDAAMDRYTFILEKLRQDDFHRIRSYTPESTAKFTTWLVVVARRLCLDQYRERYGRPRGEGKTSVEAARTRRQIEDLLVAELDLAQVPDPAANDPVQAMDAESRRRVLQGALTSLEPADRLLLKLRFENNLPAREIASLLHLPTLFHVYRRLNTVLALLRGSLAGAGVEPPD